ncbi:Equilibrative nucleoside transporter 4 [Fukomys damarensis]|uniref:Equilibrative nucleoside transporter 4 n=1 Tax=Fukomys damarensis TaxID=885580 RepID=A0A091CZT7_FUKDA|nr:Equilibrative nucleoside transporter 4 [Fukomys damarensis]
MWAAHVLSERSPGCSVTSGSTLAPAATSSTQALPWRCSLIVLQGAHAPRRMCGQECGRPEASRSHIQSTRPGSHWRCVPRAQKETKLELLVSTPWHEEAVEKEGGETGTGTGHPVSLGPKQTLRFLFAQGLLNTKGPNGEAHCDSHKQLRKMARDRILGRQNSMNKDMEPVPSDQSHPGTVTNVDSGTTKDMGHLIDVVEENWTPQVHTGGPPSGVVFQHPRSLGAFPHRKVQAAMGSMGSQRLKEPSMAGSPDRSVRTSFSFDSLPLEAASAMVEATQDQGIRARAIPSLVDSVVEEPVPEDRYHAIYFAMLLAGVGFLLPYNSFITDVDYLHHKFPGTSIVFDMSLTYILVALAAVLLNNVLVERLSLHSRITTGYLLALGPLLFISIFDVWLQLFAHDQAYAINLAAVGTVAFGCTVQQSSFYGYTGMLPKRYTQGVMTGESTAGVMISLSRILTKLLLPDERASTLIFFLVSVGLELLCFLLHLLVRRSRFVLYYTTRPRDSRRGCRAGYRVHHDVTAGDIHFKELWRRGTQRLPLPWVCGGQREGHGAGAPTGADTAVTRASPNRTQVERASAAPPSDLPVSPALLLHRYVVARVIWADMLSIAVTYFITLCLFPGLESEIRHCVLGEWLPILVMAVFNLSDFVGKILAALPVDWRGTHLLACSCLRVVFIPLFILCVYPSGAPALRHPAWPCVFSLLMGISNGYFGSVPMILAAGKVSPRQRELAGNTMTVSYMSGLTLGSAVAYCTYSLTRDAHSTCFRTATTNGSFPTGP